MDGREQGSHHCRSLLRCAGVAAAKCGPGDFVGDLLDVGVDERERVRVARGAPLPCAVLDRSGAPLEVDAARFGIERFELGNPQWPAAFLAWIGRRAASAADSR